MSRSEALKIQSGDCRMSKLGMRAVACLGEVVWLRIRPHSDIEGIREKMVINREWRGRVSPRGGGER